MKKYLLIICLIGCTVMIFAVHPGGAPLRGCGPASHHEYSSDGVRLVAGITAIIANNLEVLRNLVSPGYSIVPEPPSARCSALAWERLSEARSASWSAPPAEPWREIPSAS